jgi:DNA-binding transcriptional LysR family regulator
MRIEHINFNNLKIFETVYKEKSMTAAARMLHLTQSGVSQHILALEDELGLKLFDRINKKIIPTEAGKRLFQSSRPALLEIENTISELHSEKGILKGTVTMALPIDFGTNVVIPKLAELGQGQPGIKFDVQLDTTSRLMQNLYDGKLDFAYVDSFSFDKSVAVEPVSEETLYLCAHSQYLKGKGLPKKTKSYFENLDYVAFQDGEDILRGWMHHHLKKKSIHLNVRARVMSVYGVYKFISNGLGVGILPDHFFNSLEDHDLEVIDGSAKPLNNTISMAYLKGRSNHATVEAVKDFLRQSI